MTASRSVTYTRAEVEAILDSLASSNPTDIAEASKLFDAELVSVLDQDASMQVSEAIGYHVSENLRPSTLSDPTLASVCALLNGTLARRNGAVLKTGHADLKCSRAACGCEICPFALAACFAALDRLGASVIPLYSESRDVSQSISRFRKTWSKRLVDSDTALNLLLSRSEDDFSGILVVEDDAYLDEFVDDLTRILSRMGKIDEDGLRRQHISSLLRAVNQTDATFRSTQDENLKARQLYVCDRLSDFFERDPERDFAAKYLIERFGHIVDHRYLILVGTRDELARFIGLSPTLELLLGAHRLELTGMSALDMYRIYLTKLDEGIRESVDEGFREQFVRYVDFNRDALPFHGGELADYLAKTANASGTLKLPRSRYQSASLDEMLDGIVGLDAVKSTVKELETYAIFAKRAQGRGYTMPSSSMHMVFAGNPGTGKTTVARIIATMLYKIGIIPQNKFMEVTSKDLIAKYVGHTDKQVFETVQKARGGVLFIDEAYALMPDPHSSAGFGKEAIAALVKCMEDYRDDLIVILAGYEREMQDLIDVNPGLASRIGYTFHFSDFTTQQLVDIFDKELASSGFAAAPDVTAELVSLFEYFREFKSFGNGRFVREVLQKAVINHANRVAKSGEPAEDEDIVLQSCDIPTKREMLNCLNVESLAADEMLAPIIGLDLVKQKVRELESVVSFRSLAHRNGLKLPDMNLHMAFTGNPGTGKTTIARIVGKVLFNIGAVPTDRFIEVEAKDLASRYVGGTADETGKVIESALGGVLFIDEAYALLENQTGLEALAALVKAMEDHKGELVVMFAGYESEMRRFFDANPGLASRIGYRFAFEDYKPDELIAIFDMKMAKAGFSVTDEARAAALSLMRYFHNVENFGNGRFVDRVIQEVIALRATEKADKGNTSLPPASAVAAAPASDAGNVEKPPMPLGKLVTPQLGTGTGAGAGAGVGSTCSSAVNEPNIAVRERSDEKTAATERATYSEAVPFERIAAQHIPSIESICKLTAAAIYNPSDASADEAVRRVAAHEVGHALVSLALTGRTDIMTITIEQEGTGTLGYVQHERNANPLPTADDLESRLATLMGGMAAEELEFGGYSCGNSSDLAQATGIARAYTATYGMSSAGFVQFASPTNASGGRLEDLPVAVLDKMNELMASSFERAKRTIEANRPAFTLMTEAIIEEKTMKGGELVSLWHQATGGAENNAGAPAGNATGGSAGGNVGARTGDAGTAAGGAVAGNAMPAAAM